MKTFIAKEKGQVMSAEIIYKELLDQFKIDALRAVDEAHSKMQGDLLPYVNDDTGSNARYRAVDIVKSIMSGNFTEEDCKIKVNGWTMDTLTNFDYDVLVDVLSAKAGDKAKDLKIERLERQIQEFYSQKY